MKTRFRLMVLLPLLAAACALPDFALARPAAPRAAEGVQPESLEQGFILLVTDKPGRASSDSPISVASNHNGWNPGDPTQRLTRRSDGKWQIALPKPAFNSRMAFKFTRGNWDTVECAADFKDIDNRNLPLLDAASIKAGEKPVIELSIEHWRDERPNEPVRLGVNPYREIKVAAGRIARVEVSGGGVPVVRDLLVWLPPGYDDAANGARTYPVLYLHDGQNLFDKLEGVPGEWQVDETASRLIERGAIPPMIVVGIPAAGARRSVEYLPIPVLDNVPAAGDAYVDFLVREVMPRVEASFRVSRGPAHTAVGGSSFGAVIALHAGLRHPDRFGALLLESIPLLSKDRALMKFFAASAGKQSAAGAPALTRLRVFLGMGAKEGGDDAPKSVNDAYAASLGELRATLESAGVPGNRIKTVVGADDVHNEIAWARRLPEALEFLYASDSGR
ncbi:MAG: alpha/beta hydrolase [Phycisphaerales bacterium]